MTFCCEMGFQQVIFERDPLSVVTTLRHEAPYWSWFG
jgi:hypothetical protein